jgi:circadian clock protein KaiC
MPAIDLDPTAPHLERLPSHVPGLDPLLGGGFFRSGVYIIHGLPGSGKTIFANQLCFGHVAAGGHALYVTLLAESHSRLLQHLRSLSFFDEGAIPERLAYISAFAELESEGLKGLISVLRREMQVHKAGLLVLDGLVAAAETADTDQQLKRFIHEIQTNALFLGCTVFLLTSGVLQRASAEHTMVDGILELEDRVVGVRAERAIQVRKFRGARPLGGKHTFQITDDGLRVYPRVEALFDQPPSAAGEARGLATGIETLDHLIALGGFPANSATVVAGPTGTGKTTLGMHFLSRANADEPGLFFSFFESPQRLCATAKAYGFDFPALQASGAIALLWQPQSEHSLDELAHCLLDAVDSRRVRRLVIDGLAGFFESAINPERIGRYFSCLVNELRRRGVAVLMTVDTRDVITDVMPTPYGVSAFVDNLLALRFVEADGRVQRLLSIVKMRSSQFDAHLHVVDIGSRGMVIAGRFHPDGGPGGRKL